MLRLAEEGRLNLDDTIGQLLPGFSSPNISSAITIRQLLNHRAGTYNFGDDPDYRQALFTDWSRRWQPEEVLNYVKASYFAPGTDGQYSNTGYVLLGLIIRGVTGSSVAEEMRRTVLDRAGLYQTFMGAEESWHGPLAAPHLDFDGDGVHENLGDQSQTAILTSFWTSGAEISTAADLTRFGISLFEGGLLELRQPERHAHFPIDRHCGRPLRVRPRSVPLRRPGSNGEGPFEGGTVLRGDHSLRTGCLDRVVWWVRFGRAFTCIRRTGNQPGPTTC